MSIRRTTASLMALLRKRRLDRELESEILAHLELSERDGLARGLSPEEARRAARLRFGGIEQIKEAHRDQRSHRWIETLLRDFRFGLALLARAPGFTAVAVCVLALGIGANVAMFSVLDAVLLKPLPFRAPERIVRVWEAPRPGVLNATSTPDFLDWNRLGGDVFEALAAEQEISAAITGSGEPRRLDGKEVTAGYFRVFAATAALGRTFRPEDDQQGAASVVVLSHATWQNDFGGDPQILQRRLVLDGEPHQVIGVLPPGAFDRDQVKFWKPLVLRPDRQARNFHWLAVYGRLREGISLAHARRRMQEVHAALADLVSTDARKWTISVEPLERWLVGDNLRRSVSVAFGAVALVLLIACANVTNLLLAKGALRRRELAVRAALGAGRGRLIAQLLTESMALCLLGGAAGIALAWALIRVGKPLLAQILPYTADIALDWRVLCFGAVVVLGVALLAGTVPALRTSFGTLAESLNGSARGSSGGHAAVRRTIVIGEVAVSLVLVCGALLLFHSLLKLYQLDTGIFMENVVTMSIDLPAGSYPTAQKAAQFYQSVAQRIKAAPGVAQVAATSHLPLRWIGNGEGLTTGGSGPDVHIRFKRVDPAYFGTLGIPLLAGRAFTGRDRDGAPQVAIVNQALVARLADAAGIADPIGKKFLIGRPKYAEKGGSMPEVEIIGIIRSERVAAPGVPDPPVVYVPLAQVPSPNVKLIVRTQGDLAAVMPGIREAVREVDPNLPLGDVATMEDVRDRGLAGASRPAWLIGAFACIAVVLAAIGLYGVLSHSVTQQRREIGIRIALGAQPGDVLSQVLRNAMATVAAGLVLGLAGVFALTRVLKSLLYEVSPLDPLALGVACVSMILIGLVAGLLPASRAARVDPVTTLRNEG